MALLVASNLHNEHTEPGKRRQRAQGAGHIAVKNLDGRTRLANLYQDGCAKIRLPTDGARESVEAILINTSGGLTGGDRLDWEVVAGPQARIVATTQACEKTYRSNGGEARVSTRLKVDEGGHVGWLPQETILYDGGRIERRLEADIASGASLLAMEALVIGRKAHGETVRQGHFRDSWRVRVAGSLVHAEEMRLCGEFADMTAAPSLLNSNTAIATILLVHPQARDMVGRCRQLLADNQFRTLVHWGVSAHEIGGHGKLLARLAARDGHSLRSALIPLLGLLNEWAANGEKLPRIWTM